MVFMAAPDFDDHAFSREMASIYPEVRNALSIIVRIHSDDHGRMDENNVVPSPRSPAHAHVFSRDNKGLGLLNITGKCPRNTQEINQYIEKKDAGVPLFSAATKNQIVKWAGMKSNANKKATCWEHAVTLWKTYHPDNQFEGEV